MKRRMAFFATPARLPALVLAAATLAACAGGPPPEIPVAAGPADLGALAGDWLGEYHADTPSGRRGTILFRLEADAEVATGDVLMHLEGREALDALPMRGDPWVQAPRDRILNITFVRASGGTVFGRLDPYPDPVCGSETVTTFTGTIEGDVVRGTFTSVHVEGGAVIRGTWSVSRRTRG